MPEVTYRLDSEMRLATFLIDTAAPVNAIGEQFIKDLAECTRRANEDGVNGVILASAKQKSFLDGANLKEIRTAASAFALKHMVRSLQDVFSELAKSPFPVVAVLTGQTALGGGFEMILWTCDHVFATEGCRMGLPETNIGLFPAGGGPESLRRLVGLEKMLDLVMKGQVLPAEAYVPTGVVSIVGKKEIFLEAGKWLKNHPGVINRNYDPTWQEPGIQGIEERKQLVQQARALYCVCPERPYLRAVLDAVEEGLTLPFEEAAGAEIKYFAPLIENENVRNKIDFFFLTTSIAPKLAVANVKKAVAVPRLAILGAGLMGRGIAQVCADRGIRVLLLDVDLKTAKKAVENIDSSLDSLVRKGRWSAERKASVMANINVGDDYTALKDVPLVIEAVFEDLELKRKVLKQVQDVNPDIIFASNTSTIPMDEIAAESARPEQVVGMHYFSPVPLMPLLEVIQGPRTSESALATAVVTGRQQGKTCIVVGDGPGFYTSRTFGVYVTMGFFLAELGINPWEVDRLALEAGFPQGPLNVYGTAGGNVIYHAALFLKSRRPEFTEIPKTMINMYEAGYVGAGKPCFYKNGSQPDESVLQFIVRNESLPVPDAATAKEMLLLAMVNQAFHCLDEGVLRNYYSMDLGAVLGIGFPDCWHGPGRYVSLKGVSATRKRLQQLHDQYGLAFLTPAAEFSRLAACGVDRGLI
ncbi:3-hydroxyacyl-CoA dehydrogenase NAD-binding domain-containing protein [Desulfoglaeba alkanexedens]|uniref:Uncharacterized protein n=1 Tax=Desulfoglaeba alkanexedens ALDC TaxID=980445 RepID=A0A4P8L4Z2_9BACT|nr:3-hydroxyacyl-CoA dehydrogenase NAD-binding domain-containing protein [Desulfoglaeba alkanexedens]QCQ23028.1 hypothetical protein FDQ92_13120 [Desulfoglaeba alkanexedens ALDC]